MRSIYPTFLPLLVAIVLAASLVPSGLAQSISQQFFGIQVVDQATGRGIPLVELKTVDHIRWVTDSAGWIAFYEPGLMDQKIFFHVQSHGYEFKKDGFGNAGVALKTTPGQKARIQLKRMNIAERLYRITGEGIYRDSVLLGEPAPLAEPLGSGKVAGQDSTFGVLYQNKIFWFWGDTSRMSYPLGHFWMAGANSDFPDRNGLAPSKGINLRYFTDKEGFSRPMCRLGFTNGLIWADGFINIPDGSGKERLVCHYAHMESLYKMLGHGLAIYNDEKEEFELISKLDMKDRWRWPAQAHPFRFNAKAKPSSGGTGPADTYQEYLYFGEVFPTTRAPARLQDFTNLDSYEAWTCLSSETSSTNVTVARTPEGKVHWRWEKNDRPVDGNLERKLIESGQIKAIEARYNPLDAESGKQIKMSRGSINWNPYRKRWIMIAVEQGGSSNLGEIWYSEAAEPTGPWAKTVKIVTHKNYSFYNPVHHVFFDEEGGKIIYFEGTYVTTFTKNTDPTPRYDYNTIMYRLDLSESRLRTVE